MATAKKAPAPAAKKALAKTPIAAAVKTAAKTIAKAPITTGVKAAKPAPVRANRAGDFGTFQNRKGETLRGKVLGVVPKVNGTWLRVRVGLKSADYTEHVIRDQSFTRDKK